VGHYQHMPAELLLADLPTRGGHARS